MARALTGSEGAVLAGLAAVHGEASAREIVARAVSRGSLERVRSDGGAHLVTSSDRRRHGAIVEETRLRAATPRAPLDRMRLASTLAGIAFEPDDGQMAAIEAMATNGVCVVTGGAGTGKSTVARALCAYLDGLEPGRRHVTAFSARVADHTARRCGVGWSTLHALTGTVPGEEASPGTPVDPALTTIVVDEAFSMGPGIFHRLLRLTNLSVRIVLVGDPAQLPPIEGGRPLHDLVDLSLVPVARLTVGHRLRTAPHLARQAERAAAGKEPAPGPGLAILPAAGPAREAEAMMAGMAAKLRRRAVAEGRTCVVLTPTRHGAAGHEAIARLVTGRDRPGPGDEVITTEAHPARKWRNGERAVVSACGGFVEFEDGRSVAFSTSDPAIAFGCAMSAHRAQGLEFGEVVVVLARSGSRNATRQLVVSAMTRAPRVSILTQPGVLREVVGRCEVSARPSVVAHVTRGNGNG